MAKIDELREAIHRNGVFTDFDVAGNNENWEEELKSLIQSVIEEESNQKAREMVEKFWQWQNEQTACFCQEKEFTQWLSENGLQEGGEK
jgi:hypothetical protein